jgi:hypothetical protein
MRAMCGSFASHASVQITSPVGDITSPVVDIEVMVIGSDA